MITKVGILPPINTKLEKYTVTEEDKRKHKEFDFSNPIKLSEDSNDESSDSEDKKVNETETLIYSVVNSEEDFIEISKYFPKQEEEKLEKFTDLLIYEEINDLQILEFNNRMYFAISLESNISIYDIFIYNSLSPQISLNQSNVSNIILLELNLLSSNETFIWNWDLPSLEVTNKINIKEDIKGLFKDEKNNLFISTNKNVLSVDLRSNEINKIIDHLDITTMEFLNNEIFIGDLYGNINSFDIRSSKVPINKIKIFEKAVSSMEINNNNLFSGSIDKNISIFSRNLSLVESYKHFEPVTSFKILESNSNSCDLLVGGIGEDICLRSIKF